ncbi:putative rad5-like protein [Diaporthe ampelina]|uniref:Putative rad5-like protein n=1 Tax=Diaporthe ampelina TaxID=1214573 RepID=A0A0G2FPP6_9PEZI|nr:putative rad5-like protein [Diaporthe ampelina]
MPPQKRPREVIDLTDDDPAVGKVDNVLGSQVGHLPRKLVEKLAPHMDSGDVLAEASILGEKGYFDCPSSQSRAGLPAEPEISLEQLAQLSQAMQFRSGDDNLKTLAMDEEALSKLPQAEQPQELRSALLPYQLQGLEWLRSRENPQFPSPGSSQATQLWKRDSRGKYTNIAANFTTARTPALAKGGILADDMGLGKTLQMLSLILTGGKGATLIVSPVSVMDLFSLVKFLRLTGGIADPVVFNTAIARPLGVGDTRAEALLQSLMQDLCLRRKKEMAFVDLRLPPKSEYVHRIAFKPDEKRKYDALLSEAKGVLETFRSKQKQGKKGGTFQHVLEQLLRLRQTCNSWTLCKERIVDLLKTLEDQDVVVLNDRNRNILQKALRLYIESQDECPICLDTLSAPMITHCKHVFCGDCIRKVVQTQSKCPMCRSPLAEDQLLEPAPETAGEEEVAEPQAEAQSSKTEALLKILQATLKSKGSKVIVFSQWTSFLTIIEHQLKEAGYGYTRIDGSMTPATRDSAIRALEDDPDTKIMLASLAVCSVGLNLVAADTVVLTDSWWAPAIEDQAVDRVHRLGQTRPTTVWRLVMEGSVEERVLDIQAEKRQLVGKAFQEKVQGKKAKETRMADIMKLLT